MDFYLFQQINQFVGKWNWLDILAVFFADGFGYILIFCLILIVILKKYYRMLFQAIIAGILSRFVITEIIYFFFQRSRPFVDNSVNLLLIHQNTAIIA